MAPEPQGIVPPDDVVCEPGRHVGCIHVRRRQARQGHA
jgi:hypothetical protein